jgi:iron complex outermembrane receptor protein
MATAIATPGLAQVAGDQAASAAVDNDTIIVTARKREENVQSVPVAITAFTGEALQKAGVKSFDGLALNNPNVKIQPISSTGVGRSVMIRGNVQSSSTISVDPSVGIYLDGHILAHSFGNAGLLVDVQSVQTLKGPQGTLFGRNTTGGALLVQTVDPKIGETSGFVQAEAGSVDTYRFGGAINIPLGKIAALRVVYQNNSNGNFEFFNNITTNIPPLGKAKQEVLRAKLLIEPTDSLRVIVSAEKTNERQNTTMTLPTQPNAPLYTNVPVIVLAGGLVPGTAPSDIRSNGELAEIRSEFYGLNVTQDVASGNIKLLVSRRDWSLNSASTVGPGLGYTFQDKPGNDETSAELQYNGSLLDGKVDLASGVFYFKEHVHERQNTFLYSGTQRTTRILDLISESYSGYIQATGHLTDRLNVTGGLRYTHDKKTGVLRASTRGQGGQPDGTVPTALAQAPATLDLSASRVNYLISVDFKPIDGVMIYANHATGYRSGGAGVDRRSESLTNPLFTQLGTFNPENVKNYEVGLKSEFLDRMITFNAAAFYQDYKNYQYTAINPVTVQRETLNVDAIIKGFELDAKVRLPTSTVLAGSFGYTNAKINSGPAKGYNLSYIPRVTYSLSLNQNVKIAGGDLDLFASYNWRSRHFASITDPIAPGDEQGPSTVGSLGLVNLSATFSTGPYSLAVYADNVTNEHYITNITYSAGAVNLGSLGMPRVIGVRGKYTF